MHNVTLGPKDWVWVMENIAHTEQVEAAEDAQFGKPLKKKKTIFPNLRKYPTVMVLWHRALAWKRPLFVCLVCCLQL
jgi:hypothetical protein